MLKIIPFAPDLTSRGGAHDPTFRLARVTYKQTFRCRWSRNTRNCAIPRACASGRCSLATHPERAGTASGWFAGGFGKHFVTLPGRRSTSCNSAFGNREADQILATAAIRVNGSEPMRGTSVRSDDRNWEEHGHATNPAFEDTVLHCLSTQRANIFRVAPDQTRSAEVRRSNALARPLSATSARAARSFQAPLEILPEDRVRNVLDAAAQFRLQKRPHASQQDRQSRSRRALFQEIAARSVTNKTNFRSRC